MQKNGKIITNIRGKKMIAFLKGNIEKKDVDKVAIDVNGVGFKIYTSQNTLFKPKVFHTKNVDNVEKV